MQFVERTVDEIDAQNADSFLLQDVGRIAHIDVQQDVVCRAAWLRLKPESDPAVRIVRPGEVARGDGINEGEEARVRPAGIVQLREKVGPFLIEHCLQSLPGYVARPGAIEIVADFLVVGGNGFGDCGRGAANYEEPVRDFLSGANLCERAEGGCIEIQCERFMVGVEFFGRRHSQAALAIGVLTGA